LTLACAGLFEPKIFGLKLLKFTFNVENFIRTLSWMISSHFGAINSEMRVAAQNREKFTKTPYPRSSTMTFLRSSSPVLVMISSMFVPICNHFRVRRANNGEIALFKGDAPISPPHSSGPPSPSGMKFCCNIVETLSYHMVKTRSLYLTSWAPIDTVLWQTSRQTPRQNYHIIRDMLALERKKGHSPNSGYFTAIGSSSVKTVANRHRLAAYHNKHWWQAF